MMWDIAMAIWDSLQWIVPPVLIILSIFIAWFLLKGTRKFIKALLELIRDPLGWVFFIIVIGLGIFIYLEVKKVVGVI